MSKVKPRCALCEDRECYQGKDCFGMQEESRRAFGENLEDTHLSRVATSIESDGYMRWCRVQEVVEFARRMGYTHIGIAFCVGMVNEARAMQKILESEGFRVSSVCCKMGGIEKSELDFKHLREGRYEAICKSIGQALLLNKAGTDLNLIVGLCVGHDILFTKYSEAPVTTVVVKDRVLAHNPAGALYSNYYARNIFNKSAQTPPHKTKSKQGKKIK